MNSKTYKTLGLMSGTSMDGLDCGLFDISLTDDYKLQWKCIDFKTMQYNSKVRHVIEDALTGDYFLGKVAHLTLGHVFNELVVQFLDGREVELIGSHGQTIAHSDGKFTEQIGDIQLMKETYKVPIIHDVRQADVFEGGNGAPLMPFLDWLLFQNSNKHVITLNIGGVANVTSIHPNAERNDVIGFDTGPGMALIDTCALQCFQDKWDTDGKYSRSGETDEDLLAFCMNQTFISKQPPKSTGRHEFGESFLSIILENFSNVSPENLLRTLIHFSAQSISDNIQKYCNFTPSITEVIVSGGGVHHPLLMKTLQNMLKPAKVIISDSIGIAPDMKESLLMATLAVANKNELPANMPSVTGANDIVILGKKG